MRKFYARIFASLFICFGALVSNAQVNIYTFSQSNGTYTPITGGTQVARATTTNSTAATTLDDVNYSATLPFTFTFNNVPYTSININTNGSISFGTTPTSTSEYSPISSTTGYAGDISVLGGDMRGNFQTTADRTSGSNQLTNVNNTSGLVVGDLITGTGIPAAATVTAISGTTVTISANATSTGAAGTIYTASGEIRTQTLGSAPNRTFVIQWSGFQRYAVNNSTLNFQIRLNEGGGAAANQTIDFVYGTFSHTTANLTAQVGLRGASNADYNNRTTTTDWSASTAGASNSANMRIGSTVLPASGLTYTWTPPAACSGAPTAGTATATPGAVCYSGSVTLSLTGYTTGASGISIQWQVAPIATTAWTDIAGANTASYTFNALQSFQYRAKVTCSTTGISDFSTPLAVSVSSAPAYVTLPFTESFESWINGCGTNDRPGVNWGSSPSTGNNSWRRDDQGVANASWTSNNGAYSPLFTTGAHSARFHSYNATSGTSGNLDLFIDLSSTTGTNYLSFDYINPTGTDKLQVFVSTDGGFNFTQVGADLVAQSSWANKQFPITGNSATTIIRLKATSDFGNDDIGVDNLTIIPSCSGTPVAGTTVAASNPTCYNGSTVLSLTGTTPGVGGLTYQWQSSTNGTTWTDIVGATSSTLSVNGTLTPLQYRAVVTCTNGGASDNSAPLTVTMSLPTYASIPFTEDFESWSNNCSTTDKPGVNWGNSPSTGNNSWRRDDQGVSSAGWTSNGGAYSPVFTTGAHSARFHSFNATAGLKGTLDLFINLSTDPGDKLLKFDYINTSGTDVLKVFLSTDGGATFTQVGSNLGVQATWANKQFVISSASATAVIRLEATSDFGGSDIGVDNLQVVVGCTSTPTPGSISTTGTLPLCSGNGITLNLTGQSGSAGITYQWQSSPDNTTWTDIASATSSSYTATPTTNTYYRVVVTCSNTSQSAPTAGFQVTVNSPTITSTTPATRCGIGTTTLQAAGSAGTTLNWYTSSTGGTPIGTGTSFTTPSISSTTTYYVEASIGGSSAFVGPTYSGTSNNGTNVGSHGIMITTTQPNVLINSVDIPFTGTGTFTIALKDPSNTTVITSVTTGSVTGAGTTSVTVPLGLTVSTPGSYLLIVNAITGTINNLGYKAGNSFPYTALGGAISITNGYWYAADPDEMYLFNLNVFVGCASPRTAVTATVTTPPTISVLPASATICSGQSATLVVNSANTGYTYSWTPGGQTGSPVSVSPTTTTKYFVTATDNSGGANNGCVTKDSVTVNVNPLPTAPVVTPSSPSACAGTVQTLNAVSSQSNTLSFGTQANQNSASTTSTGYPSTYSNYYGGNRQQFLVLASELTAAGYTAGSKFTSVQFPVVSLGSNFTANQNFQVSIGQTSLTSLSAFQSGLTQVVAPATFTPTVGYNNTHTFSAPFTWDGTSNIIIETTYSNGNTGGTNDLVVQYNSPTSFQSTIVYRVDATTAATVAAATTVSYSYNARPDFKLNGTAPASIVWSPTTGLYTDAAGTIPYTGTATATVYAKPAATTVYTVTGSNVYTCSASSTVTVAITPATVINTQPQSQIACTGSTVTLSVAAGGAGLSYQWRKNGANVGTNSASLILTNVQPSDAGNYDVVVTGSCGSVTSSVAVLQIGDNSWVGTSNSDWNNPLNWCGGLPTATTNVLIPSGTPFSPIVTANAPVNNIAINNGATLTVTSSGRLQVGGSITNNGTFNTTAGTIEFRGAANQNVPAITADNIIMNGAGGITLGGNMTIGTALTLTNGNITLGNNNLTMTGGSAGSVASHIVTNGTGKVTANNVGVASVIFPVGPTATSYNPVMIANGQGKNYTVGVVTGLPTTPALANSARAVNRTWNITVNSAPTSPVNVAVQYADADMNASGTGSANMEAGVSNGTSWLITTPAGGMPPVGTAAARVVGFQTITFGTTVIANIGGVNFPLAVPNVDADVTSIILMPNPVVDNNSVLRVNTRRTMKVQWSVVDANGRVVMTFEKQIFAGQNDIQLKLMGLAAGTYQLTGKTDKGKTTTVRFVRM